MKHFIIGCLLLGIVNTAQAQQVSNFDLGAFEIKPLGSSTQIRMGRSAEIAKFRIQNRSKRNLELESIRLRNYGSSNLRKSFEDWELLHNGQPIPIQTSSLSKYLQIQLKNPVYIARGDNMVLSLKGRLIYAKNGNPTVQLGLKRQEDITLTDVSSGFNLSCQDCEGVKFKTQTLNPGGVYLSQNNYYRGSYRTAARYNYRSKSSPQIKKTVPPQTNQSYNPGSRDVLFFQTYLRGQRGFRAEGLFLSLGSGSFAHDKNNDGQNSSQEDFNATFEDYTLVVDQHQADYTSGLSSHQGPMGLHFDSPFEIGSNSLLQVYGRIDTRAVQGDKIRFNLDPASFQDLKYLNNGRSVHSSNINGSTLSPTQSVETNTELKISK